MSIRSILRPIKRSLRKNRQFYLRIAPLFGVYRNIRIVCTRLFRGYDDNMVVFSSFYGRAYNDSPRYISEALHAKRPETKIVWLFKDPETIRDQYDIPDYVHVYHNIERKGVASLARARVVVDNTAKRFYLKFPGKGQIYLQTWHGDRAIKKVGFDNEDVHHHRPEEKLSLIMVGSDFGEQVMRTALRHNGEVMKQGIPRNDVLVRNDPAERAAIRQKLNLDSDTRVLVFAPTFRDSETGKNRDQRVPLDLSHVLDTLEKTTGEKWKCLVRAHYLAHGLAFDYNSERFIAATEYPEMAELLLIADALLTDYSSCATDFILTHRPVYLYQDDEIEYTTQNREFYVPIDSCGFWIAHTPEELDALIEQTTPERAAENCDHLLAFYSTKETGHATESAVDYIISKLAPVKK